MKTKILLVDDREDNLLSIEAILEPNGYIFRKANSGRQALKILLTEFDFAMILMDVKMPNLNGFETASLIYEREKLRHIPIIFITANNYGDENMFQGYRAGAIDYIFKPINPDILRAKVSVLVDLYQKNRLLHEQEQKLLSINRNLEREIEERIASEEKVKHLNKQLLENISTLESANKDLDRFTFMASHDLQEPLRKIRLFTDMLMAKHGEKLAGDSTMISRIGKSAERMQTLIKDILSFSKLSSEPPALVQADVTQILHDLVNELGDELREIDASIEIEPIPPLLVSPRLIRVLFENLINNSLKYRNKSVRLAIRISARISMGISDLSNKSLVSKFCRIHVEDNGIGFDQKYAEEIFGMLKRLHQNGEFEGTGVGLALCKRIAELHGGHIAATGKVNKGATIIVTLPLPKEEGVSVPLTNAVPKSP